MLQDAATKQLERVVNELKVDPLQWLPPKRVLKQCETEDTPHIGYDRERSKTISINHLHVRNVYVADSHNYLQFRTDTADGVLGAQASPFVVTQYDLEFLFPPQVSCLTQTLWNPNEFPDGSQLLEVCFPFYNKRGFHGVEIERGMQRKGTALETRTRYDQRGVIQKVSLSLKVLGSGEDNLRTRRRLGIERFLDETEAVELRYMVRRGRLVLSDRYRYTPQRGDVVDMLMGTRFKKERFRSLGDTTAKQEGLSCTEIIDITRDRRTIEVTLKEVKYEVTMPPLVAPKVELANIEERLFNGIADKPVFI